MPVIVPTPASTPRAALLLDLDGTLVDSCHDIAAAGNAARRALGYSEQPIETIATYVGDGLGKLLERLFPDADEALLREAHKQFHAFYAEHCCDHTHLFSGISEVLHTAHDAGWKLAVVSNKPVVYCRQIIEATDIAPLISFIIGGDAERKPDPQQLLTTCTELSVQPHNAWMIGDHHTDIGAAAAAGTRSAWCSWGMGHQGEHRCDMQLDQPSDILRVLHV